jgi:hypothetical protein
VTISRTDKIHGGVDVRVIAIDGTPEELAKFEELTGWVGSAQRSNGQGPDKGSINSALDAELVEFLRNRASGKVRFERARDFVERALALGDIEPDPGRSKGTKGGLGKYLRLYRKGPRRLGAACYLKPGSSLAEFRLPKEAAAGRKYAEVRDPSSESTYNVRVYLTSEEAITEALELLSEAIRRIEHA